MSNLIQKKKELVALIFVSSLFLFWKHWMKVYLVYHVKEVDYLDYYQNMERDMLHV